MTRRRAKLSPDQRARRSEKRARRAAEAPEREAARAARDRVRALLTPTLVLAADDVEPVERVICERCGLEQENDRGTFLDDGTVVIRPCDGWEGIGCGSEAAITHERHVEECGGVVYAAA